MLLFIKVSVQEREEKPALSLTLPAPPFLGSFPLTPFFVTRSELDKVKLIKGLILSPSSADDRVQTAC